MSFITKDSCKCCGMDMTDLTQKYEEFCSKSCIQIHSQKYRQEVTKAIMDIYRKYYH